MNNKNIWFGGTLLAVLIIGGYLIWSCACGGSVTINNYPPQIGGGSGAPTATTMAGKVDTPKKRASKSSLEPKGTGTDTMVAHCQEAIDLTLNLVYKCYGEKLVGPLPLGEGGSGYCCDHPPCCNRSIPTYQGDITYIPYTIPDDIGQTTGTPIDDPMIYSQPIQDDLHPDIPIIAPTLPGPNPNSNPGAALILPFPFPPSIYSAGFTPPISSASSVPENNSGWSLAIGLAMICIWVNLRKRKEI